MVGYCVRFVFVILHEFERERVGKSRIVSAMEG